MPVFLGRTSPETPPEMTRHNASVLRRFILVASVGLMLFSLAGFVWLNAKLSGRSLWGADPVLPVLARLPDFQLTTEAGQPFGLADLRGKVWISDFIFTRCPGPCPRMTARMAELQRQLADAVDLRLVSFSVDPEFDTPVVLSEYARRFQAQPERWVFLTGDKKSIHALAKSGFLVGGVEDVTLHTTRFILVDRQACVRGYYDSADEESLERLLKDARRLVRGSDV
jgi:protein SCO1